ncbi:hypothetical protein [Nocardia sp. BMG111209]|uniref:hypothetical protein n=1 Tax=Nocardia sp. BMG111209 TaxID=1160137 RepID=UPI000378355C|nr:hypothetical protein [Nocardia sp. BMG111209]
MRSGYSVCGRCCGLLGFSTVTGTFNRTAAATVIAGTGCLATLALLDHSLTGPVAGPLITLAAGVLTGSVTSLAAAELIGIPEIRTARALLTR